MSEQQAQEKQSGKHNEKRDQEPPCELILSPVLPPWDNAGEARPSVGQIAPGGLLEIDLQRDKIWNSATDSRGRRAEPQTYASTSRKSREIPVTTAVSTISSVKSTAGGFVSPRPALAHGWTSQSLFSKHAPSPSPIATVLPQVHAPPAKERRAGVSRTLLHLNKLELEHLRLQINHFVMKCWRSISKNCLNFAMKEMLI